MQRGLSASLASVVRQVRCQTSWQCREVRALRFEFACCSLMRVCFCSYNAVNGVPACASPGLLQKASCCASSSLWPLECWLLSCAAGLSGMKAAAGLVCMPAEVTCRLRPEA